MSFQVYNTFGSSISLSSGMVNSSNSSDKLLLAGETFTGQATNVVEYPCVSCSVISDQTGTLYIEFSGDSVNWDISKSYDYTATSTALVKLTNTEAKFLRVRFTNTGANQTVFRLQTILGFQHPETKVNNEVITEYPRTYLDGFNRLRVSNINTIFDSKQIYAEAGTASQTLFWDTEITGGTNTSVYNANDASTSLSVSEVGVVRRQTFQRFNYQPGKSQLCYITGVLKESVVFDDDVTSRIGYFDNNNGMFFEYNGANGSSIVIRKNSNDTKVAQTNWNLDRMDGSGPSKITLDFSKTQIFVINFEWLGVGTVWWGFVVNGLLHWVHTSNHSNIETTVYTRTPNNPIRYEIESSAGGNGSMSAICASVNTEGGLDATGFVRSIARPPTNKVDANTLGIEYVVLLLRYKDLIASQITINLLSASVLATTNDNYMWLIRIMNDLGNITGSLPAWQPINKSPLEVNQPNGPIVNNDGILGNSGMIVASGYGTGKTADATSVPINNFLRLGFNLAGTSQIVCLSVIPFSAGLDFYGSLTWREVS